MEQNLFTGVEPKAGWWLLQPEADLDPTLVEKRKELAACWGFTDYLWFDEPLNVTKIYDFLYANQQDLLGLEKLDNATQLFEHQAWLDGVIAAKKRSEEKNKATVVEEAPSTGTSAPTVPQAPPVPPPAAPKPSAFGRRAAETATAEQPSGTATAAQTATPTETPAEPRKPSPFAKKAAPAAEPATPPPATPPPPAAAESVAEIRASLSELAADPAVPISAQEVDQLLKDPDFQKHLADAERDIEAELEAELAALESEG